MKYIDAAKIEDLLKGPIDQSHLDDVLDKAKALQRLSVEEVAMLLRTEDQQSINKIYDAAAYVKEVIYGRRVVLFAPLYISNKCINNCKYCAFKTDNKLVERKALTPDQTIDQVKWLLGRGHKRILMVTGEAAKVNGMRNIDYYCQAIDAIYSASVGPHKIKRVNVNCAPLEVEEFKQLKAAGIGTYQLFQESYHDRTYRDVHVSGPKSDPDKRLNAIDDAFKAGIDDVGVGVLYGLYDYKFETLAMMMHVEHLENAYNVGPHTISVPRIEPALGSDLSTHVPHAVSDDDFVKLVAILRLAVPYTGIILSTREDGPMRDKLVNLGISQVSAESSTSPGGYADSQGHDHDMQFSVGDHRSLDEIIGSLINQKYLPSFCAACYRKSRTGKTFMDLAKPGDIKGKCQVNGLVTLKEYLDDFASADVKVAGQKLINELTGEMDAETQKFLAEFFDHIKHGKRDEYV
jgi:2-iminoacetate synthase